MRTYCLAAGFGLLLSTLAGCCCLPVTSASSALQTSVPAPTYPTASDELRYFNRINSIRQANGLGLLAQNAKLDRAVVDHAGYLGSHTYTNDELRSGVEFSQYAGFTGTTAQDRCNHVGYSGTCVQTSMQSEPLIVLAPSPYLGLLVLKQGEREIGITVPRCAVFTGTFCGPHLQLGLPVCAVPQQPTDGFLLITALWNAFHVQVKEGETLAITGLQVRDAANNVLSGNLLTHANDPLQRVPVHAAVFVPAQRGPCGASYTLDVAGLRNGVPFAVTRSLVETCQ